MKKKDDDSASSRLNDCCHGIILLGRLHERCRRS